MKTAILAIVLFCLMIFPHELGHFIAAKSCNVQVNEFSFGMGPAIWKKQKGETLYAIRILPIGGYCAMDEDAAVFGDEIDGEVPPNPRSFRAKKPWQKLLILAAGSLMNILTAILVMTLVLLISGHTTTKIAEITPGSPADLAGFEVGDKIVEIADEKIDNWNQVGTILNASEGNETSFIIARHGKKLELKATPEYNEVYDEAGTLLGYRYIVGVTCKIGHNPFFSLVNGATSTWNIAKLEFTSFGDLFRGKVGMEELSGPVGIVTMVNETIDYGFWYYGFLVALICVNLAIVNMFPFPALDGGRIIFVLFTLITGKKVNEKVESIVHAIGIILLLGLMVFVTWNDIVRIFTK